VPKPICPLLLALAAAISLPAHGQAPREGSARALLDSVAASGAFNGVILLAHGQRVVDQRAAGMARVDPRAPMTSATRFELGSVSKWVTSLLVLKLADQGALSLDVPVRTYLPEYAGEGGRVTLHHLLTHTSGIPNDVVAALRRDSTVARQSLPSAEAIRRYAAGALLFEPGARFDYSHSNWIVVAAVIERVTGRSVAANLRALLTGPLGLRDTGTFTGDFAGVPGSAWGYSGLRPAPGRRASPMPDFLVSAGGIHSTGPDLLRLMDAVYGGRVLSAASLRRLDQVYVPGEDYAYGSRVRQVMLGGRARSVAWHSGSNGAAKTLAVRVLDDDGWTVILLTNVNTDPAVLSGIATRALEAVYTRPR